jgi:hypothetical protein
MRTWISPFFSVPGIFGNWGSVESTLALLAYHESGVIASKEHYVHDAQHGE